MSEKEVFYKVDDEEYVDEELALSILLKEGVLFSNCRYYSMTSNGMTDGRTVVLFVLCNDIFAWGCADGENLPYEEISNLYKMWEKDKKWGAAKWCCIQRNEKPQNPVVKLMKENGSWDEQMEKLPDNYYDKKCRERYEEKLREKQLL